MRSLVIVTMLGIGWLGYLLSTPGTHIPTNWSVVHQLQYRAYVLTDKFGWMADNKINRNYKHFQSLNDQALEFGADQLEHEQCVAKGCSAAATEHVRSKLASWSIRDVPNR
jgi:hypothetical protein